jgi:hypothetical protein
MGRRRPRNDTVDRYTDAKSKFRRPNRDETGLPRCWRAIRRCTSHRISCCSGFGPANIASRRPIERPVGATAPASESARCAFPSAASGVLIRNS